MSLRTGLPVVHLDRYYWRAAWDPTPAGEWTEVVADLLRAEGWIMDGNYRGTMAQRIEAAATVIFLNFPRTICVWRIIKRRVRSLVTPREDLPNGCRDRLTREFLTYIWGHAATRVPKILERLQRVQYDKRVEILDNDTSVRRFLDGCSAR